MGMTTKTSSSKATTTDTMVQQQQQEQQQQQQQQQSFKLTERIVPWKVPKLADKHTNQNNEDNNLPTTFFPLNIFGLSAPPMVIPVILLLLSKYREIPVEDHVFSIGYALYLCFANKFRFNMNAKQVALRKSREEAFPEKPEWFEASNEEWFDKYMAFAAVLGLVLPLLVEVFAPRPMAQATSPHLYILFFQILMELMGNSPNFHPMLQVAVPIGYSVYRLGSLKTWLEVAWNLMGQGSDTDITWAKVHFGLALTNVIFWSYNTFFMLLLRVLPPCLDENKFPDASVSWKYQLVPVVVDESNGTTASKGRTD